jgi:hypothetical protein
VGLDLGAEADGPYEFWIGDYCEKNWVLYNKDVNDPFNIRNFSF